MKIALFNVMIPFMRGGAEVQVEDLENELKKNGHDVDVFRLPFPHSDYNKIIENVYAVLSLRFDEYDVVISFKFPVYLVKHRKNIPWICHQFRQVYDLWNTEYGLNEKDYNSVMLKNLITTLDDKFVKNTKTIFTNGLEVHKRFKKYNKNNKSIPLYPPLKDNKIFYNSKQGDYFYYPSRIDELKRQKMVVESLKYTKTNVRIIISGKFSDDKYKNEIYDVIKKNKLTNKVVVIEGWISEEEKCRLYAESLGVIFAPYLEDYGYITAEAFYSHKPVITCKDSGGPLGHVKDGENGLIVDSSPKEIAKALDYFYENRDKAKEMGENAYNYIESANITWEETIKRLLD